MSQPFEIRAEPRRLQDADAIRGGAQQYVRNQPCPHIVLDELLPEPLLRVVARDVAASQISRENGFYVPFDKCTPPPGAVVHCAKGTARKRACRQR